MISMSKRRSPNFTPQEIHILIDEVEKNKSVLLSRLSNTVTNISKKRAWEVTCSKVNAVNDTGYLRTVDEIRKKWTCYVSCTKKKIAENKRESRRTGGGPPQNSVSPEEKKIAVILGNIPNTSIDDDIDTCETTEEYDSFISLPSSAKYRRFSSSRSNIIEQALNSSDDNSSDDDDIDDMIVIEDMSSCKVNKFNKPTKKSSMTNEILRLIEIENERLKVEKERLEIEKSRLEVEKDMYKLKMQKVKIEKEKLEVEKGRYQMELARHQLQIAMHNATVSLPDA